jgi:chromosome segregation ATPase
MTYNVQHNIPRYLPQNIPQRQPLIQGYSARPFVPTLSSETFKAGLAKVMSSESEQPASTKQISKKRKFTQEASTTDISAKKRKTTPIPVDSSSDTRDSSSDSSDSSSDSSEKSSHASAIPCKLLTEEERSLKLSDIKKCQATLRKRKKEKEQLTTVKKNLYKFEYEIARDNHLRILEDKRKLDQQCQSLQAELAEKNSQIEKLNSQQLSSKQSAQGDKKEIERLNTQLQVSKKINWNLNKKRQEEKDGLELKWESKLIAVEDHQQKKHKAEQQKLQTELDRVNAQVKVLNGKAAQVDLQMKELQEKLTDKTKEVSELNQQCSSYLDSYRQEQAIAQAEIQQLKSSLSEVQTSLFQTQTREKYLEVERKKILSENEQLKTQLREMQQQQSDKDRIILQYQNFRSNLMNQLQNMK